MRPESKRVLNPSLSYRLFMLGLFLVLPKAVDAWLESRAPPTISARGAAQTARFQFGKAFLGGRLDNPAKVDYTNYIRRRFFHTTNNFGPPSLIPFDDPEPHLYLLRRAS